MFRDQYRAASRKDKPTVAWELVECWRSKNKPPGRFLTRTDPKLGDASLWHDVGDDVAMKKASKVLSEKTPPSSQGGVGDSRKRQASSSDQDQRSPKKARKEAHPAQDPAVVPTVTPSELGTGLTRITRTSQARIPTFQDVRPIQQQLLQLSSSSTSPSAMHQSWLLRDIHGTSPAASGHQNGNTTLMARNDIMATSPDSFSSALLRRATAPPGTTSTDLLAASLLNSATPSTALASSLASNSVLAPGMSHAAVFSTSSRVAQAVDDLEMSAQISLLLANAATPTTSQGFTQAALLRSTLSENPSLAAASLALIAQSNQNSSGVNTPRVPIHLPGESSAQQRSLANSSVPTRSLSSTMAPNQLSDARSIEAALLVQSIVLWLRDNGNR